MNEEQTKSGIRSILIGVAGIALGWFANGGYVSADQISGIMSSPVFISFVTMISGAIWGLITHKQSNAVAVVAAMAADPSSPVKGVVMEPTIEGLGITKAITSSNPDAPIAAAGSTAALTIAKVPTTPTQTNGEHEESKARSSSSSSKDYQTEM
jgi:hypothetical protein